MSVRCSKFESDPSKELCSVLSWSQFTLNPRILPDHLCSDLKSSVSLTTAISPTSRAECIQSKDLRRVPGHLLRAGHLLNDSAALGEIVYATLKKSEKKRICKKG